MFKIKNIKKFVSIVCTILTFHSATSAFRIEEEIDEEYNYVSTKITFDKPSLHALEGIRRGPGFERAAPEDVRTGILHSGGHLDDLGFRFHTAGAGDHGEMAAADLCVADAHHRVLGMELPVGLLEGFGYPLDGLHDLQTVQKFHIHPAGIADEAQNGDVLTVGHMDVQIHMLQPLYQMSLLLLCGTTLQNRDHSKQLLSKK